MGVKAKLYIAHRNQIYQQIYLKLKINKIRYNFSLFFFMFYHIYFLNYFLNYDLFLFIKL